MKDYPIYMENSETAACYLIVDEKHTGAHIGIILHDNDFDKRRAGDYSDHWKKSLVPMQGRLLLSNDSMMSHINGYPQLMKSIDHNGLIKSIFIITGCTPSGMYKGTRIVGNHIGAKSDTWTSSLQTFHGSVSLFNK